MLAHDWLVANRGGERVLDAIARLVGSQHDIVGVYTMFADERVRARFASDEEPDANTWGIASLWEHDRVYSSRLGRVPGALACRRWMLPLYPVAVSQLSRAIAGEHARAPIDLAISTSSAAVKNLRLPEGVPHVCYCHAPARYLWSQADSYATGKGGVPRRLGLSVFGEALRAWDRAGSEGVHTFVANSSFIAQQIHEHYSRPAIVVHPPVQTEYFTPDPSGRPRTSWLYVGALEPYKRADLAISAAAIAKAELIIIGNGSQSSDVRRLAASASAKGANIRVIDGVTRDELRTHYRSAALLLFPQIEDFGMVSVEAQACGTPVVARAEGGALDSVIDGVTGTLFHDATPESLALAATRCISLKLDAVECRRNAENFSLAAFDARFARVLKQVVV